MRENNNLKFVNYLFKKYAWIYEFVGGDSGIIIADTKEDVINILKKNYNENIDKMLENNGYQPELYIYGIESIDHNTEDGIYITYPI